MEAYLENEGYFNSKVSGDTTKKKYMLGVGYSAFITRPYLFDTIRWRLDSSKLSKDILRLPMNGAIVKKGHRYRVDDIKAETERISGLMKEKGYYYFKPDYILTYVDTNHRNFTASVYFLVDEDMPAYARLPYKIGRIVAAVPERQGYSIDDSTVSKMVLNNGVFVADPQKKFRSQIFPAAIVLRSGQWYQPKEQTQSLTRLNSYGVFKFIKNEFRRTTDSAGNNLLNTYYYTSPYPKKSFQFEVGGFAKSNNYWGGEASFNWKNRNIFHGAEILSIRPKGSFEVSFNDSLKNNNTFRVGLESELTFPKFLVPGLWKKSFTYIPKTKIIASYDWVRRQELYTELYAHLRYELNWSNKISKEHRLVPISFTHRTSGEFTEQFLSNASRDPSLEFTLPSSFVPASSYNYLFTNTSFRRRKFYFLQASIETAGFLTGLIKGNDGPFTTKIGSAYLMQYVRGELDVRYSQKVSQEVDLFHRGIIGISYPYNNSVFMPFFKQFIIGGANSLRGFVPKQIGPGSARATALQISSYPQIGGDYKLELNSELRFPLAGRLKGGLFVDAGNIWMKDTILYKEAGKLTKDFWKQIAIDAGTGIRLDISILVLRLDLGIPFYKPWLPEGDRWTFQYFDLGSSDWRKENLVLNLAIGHAF